MRCGLQFCTACDIHVDAIDFHAIVSWDKQVLSPVDDTRLDYVAVLRRNGDPGLWRFDFELLALNNQAYLFSAKCLAVSYAPLRAAAFASLISGTYSSSPQLLQ